MTKQELEEKIKNNEDVWCCYVAEHRIAKLNDSYDFKSYKIFDKDLIFGNDKYYYPLKYLFSTKAQAQHYLDCGNVTRTEKLPYITWEEVQYQHKGYGKNYYTIEFNSLNQIGSEKKSGIEINWQNNSIGVFKDYCWQDAVRFYEITEENFYKAYKVAKDLFLGGK